MSDGRCRACGAALAPSATWCSLCFADLRPPAAEPVREPATVAAAPATTTQLAASAAVSVEGPLDPPASVEIDLSDPLGMGSAPPGPPAGRHAGTSAVTPTWPCPRCSHQVSIDLDACDACGAGFLAGAATSKSLRLPVVGEVTSMSSSQRLLMAVGVALTVTVVLVLLAFVGGHLFN